MWILTTIGFFSVVQKPGTDFLTVRARVAADLERLRQLYMPALSDTIKHAGTDYPYRAIVPHVDFARGMARMAERIHYSNFKEEVGEKLGPQRERIYAEAWAALKKLEQPAIDPARAGSAGSNGKRSYGAVVVDRAGRLLLRESRDRADGHAWTFPAGKPLPREAPEEAARRHVMHATGVAAETARPLPGLFGDDGSETVFYLMSAVQDTGSCGPETASICWASPEEARRRIAETRDPAGQARDLEVLEAALNLLARLALQF